MANWYTADTHFLHENIISFCQRPFNSVDEMDAALIENMWAVVQPEDELWIVGDFAYGPRSKDQSKLQKIFDQMPGAKKHIVTGNHDLEPTLDLPWDSIHSLVEVRDGPHNQAHTLCHYPLITWNHARRQALHMFGHVHNNWLGSRNAVNVGVDVWKFMPVSFEQIAGRAMELPPNMHLNEVEPGIVGI